MHGVAKSQTQFHFHFSLSCIGGGNGNPLQYSCLENPRDRGTWWAAVYGVAESDKIERLHFHFSLSCIGGGNGNPLQCSCLENPRNGGAWWSAVYGVSQSRTGLKQLSSSSSRKHKRPILAKTILGKKNGTGGKNLSDFRLYYNTVIETVW